MHPPCCLSSRHPSTSSRVSSSSIVHQMVQSQAAFEVFSNSFLRNQSDWIGFELNKNKLTSWKGQDQQTTSHQFSSYYWLVVLSCFLFSSTKKSPLMLVRDFRWRTHFMNGWIFHHIWVYFPRLSSWNKGCWLLGNDFNGTKIQWYNRSTEQEEESKDQRKGTTPTPEPNLNPQPTDTNGHRKDVKNPEWIVPRRPWWREWGKRFRITKKIWCHQSSCWANATSPRNLANQRQLFIIVALCTQTMQFWFSNHGIHQ